MELIEISDFKQYSDFAARLPRAEFLQSASWPEIAGGQARHFFVMENENICAATRVLARQAAGVRYWSSPRAPIFAPHLGTEDMHRALFCLESGLKAEARKNKVAFWRLEPAISAAVWPEVSRDIAFKKIASIQPERTLLIDLRNTGEEVLSAMHQKTRYNIRLAEKKGVTIREAKSGEEAKFNSLMAETANRDRFRIHAPEHYAKMISLGQKIFKLFLAEKDGDMLAGGIFAFFGDTVTYVHGASSNDNRQLMAPYLLHWRLIQEAQKLGFAYYDFYGVDKNKWPGVTRFKMGFGGHIEAYPGTFDIIFQASYYGYYRVIRAIRRFMPF